MFAKSSLTFAIFDDRTGVCISEQTGVPSRSWVPSRLIGAIENSLARWQDLLDVIEAHPHLWEELATSTLLGKTEGRPRMPGEWAIAYLLFVNSAEREMERWYRSTSMEMWSRLGFVQFPSYKALYKNFVQLEEHPEAFRAVAAVLVQIAVVESDGKVGHAVHVDGTEAETNSRLVHDCYGSELDTCQQRVKTPIRATNADARSERHKMAEDVPTDEDIFGATEDYNADERGLRVKVNGCWYLLSDPEAGVRAYSTSDGKLRKFWAGYYNLKAVDHYTGAVLGVHVTHASMQEHIGYVDLYEQIKQQIGKAPRAIVADRGFSIEKVFEMHTRDGVASVIPWRKHWHEDKRRDHDRYDRHGIPSCKHCGGEGKFIRFKHDAPPAGHPRLWFTCARPVDGECEKHQSIQCSTDWRLLLPLWRTSPAYQVLRVRHQNYESVHHRWRERYAVGGDTKADRPKRRGLGVQQLRASASLVIEWLTVCHRQGWLPGGEVINTREEVVISKAHAATYCSRLLASRAAHGIGEVFESDMADHQAEVLAAYASSSSSYGPTSAHGAAITAQLRAEERWRKKATEIVDEEPE